MEYALEAINLTKKFKKHVAVHDVSFRVKKGEIYGLIGKNGAGKTTLIKLACNLLTPTQGEVKIFGDSKANFSRVGVLVENPGYYPNLSATENLKLKCMCLGIDTPGYIEQKLELVGLGGVGKKHVKHFSLGMKQRLGIAMALVGEPDILLLDEPINGLDPEGIVDVRETLMKLNQELGITIVISSHILEELSKIVTSYCFIDKGEIIKQISKDDLENDCSEKIVMHTEQTDKAVTVLDSMGFNNYKVIDTNVIDIYERLDEVPEIIFAMAKERIRINQIGLVNQDIESYFLEITGGAKND